MPRSESTPQAASEATPEEFPLDQLREHRGRWVAFSRDGRSLIASAGSLVNLELKIREAGENPEEVLLDRIPSGDSIVSGSELS